VGVLAEYLAVDLTAVAFDKAKMHRGCVAVGPRRFASIAVA